MKLTKYAVYFIVAFMFFFYLMWMFNVSLAPGQVVGLIIIFLALGLVGLFMWLEIGKRAKGDMLEYHASEAAKKYWKKFMNEDLTNSESESKKRRFCNKLVYGFRFKKKLTGTYVILAVEAGEGGNFDVVRRKESADMNDWDNLWEDIGGILVGSIADINEIELKRKYYAPATQTNVNVGNEGRFGEDDEKEFKKLKK